MSDIMERLHFYSEHPMTGKMVLTNPDGPDAADEIERLRAENERLRAALRAIAYARPECCEITNAMQFIARAALEEQTP